MQVYDGCTPYDLCVDKTGIQTASPVPIMDLHSNQVDKDRDTQELREKVCTQVEESIDHPSLLVIPHLEIPGSSTVSTGWVDEYRSSILNTIREGLKELEKSLAQSQECNEKETAGDEKRSNSDVEEEVTGRWNKPCLIVGVKDFRTEVSHTVSAKDDALSLLERLWINDKDIKIKETRPEYVPLSMMVLRDIEETFSEKLTIREFFMCVPHGYHCKSQTPIDVLKKEIKAERERWEREIILRSHGIIHEELVPIVQAHYFVFELNE
jgi:hypothetical protein